MRNTLQLRQELLNLLGGLPEPRVENQEWLYLLSEETRNSISLEGYFLSEKDFKEVIFKGRRELRDEEVALRYFKTALFIYGFGYENWRMGEFTLNQALIRQINKGVTGRFGDYRKGDLIIAGAKLRPPSGFYLKEWMDLFLEWQTKALRVEKDLIKSLAKAHILFESIHPFQDGNGRTGRILLNYLLLSFGYPPMVIKGIDPKDRETYIKALEAGDEPLREVLNQEPNKRDLFQAMEAVNSTLLEKILARALIESLDKILWHLFEKEKGVKPKPSPEVARTLGYAPDTMRELIRRGHFVAVKKGKTWFTHPKLDLRKLSPNLLLASL